MELGTPCRGLVDNTFACPTEPELHVSVKISRKYVKLELPTDRPYHVFCFPATQLMKMPQH